VNNLAVNSLDPFPETSQSGCKPFIKWAGGKQQILSHLRAKLPKSFNRYFEPFLGGGALFFDLSPKSAVLVDQNEELINTYLVVRDQPQLLLEDLSRHVYNKEYFYQVRDADRQSDYLEWSPVQRASRFIFLNKTCFNGLYRVNSKGQFNVPFGSYTMPKIADGKNILACSKALQGVDLIKGNFSSVADLAKRGDFIYLDPPYIPRTQSSSFTSYTSDKFSNDDHLALKRFCAELDSNGVYFMLSNSYTTLALDLYKKFEISEVEA